MPPLDVRLDVPASLDRMLRELSHDRTVLRVLTLIDRVADDRYAVSLFVDGRGSDLLRPLPTAHAKLEGLDRASADGAARWCASHHERARTSHELAQWELQTSSTQWPQRQNLSLPLRAKEVAALSEMVHLERLQLTNATPTTERGEPSTGQLTVVLHGRFGEALPFEAPLFWQLTDDSDHAKLAAECKAQVEAAAAELGIACDVRE